MFNRFASYQRSRLTACHPCGRTEVLHYGPSPSVWALFCEIREKGLIADTVHLRVDVVDAYRSPFAP